METKKAIFLMFALMFYFSSAQTFSVKGTVTDESKVPLPGVGITVKNTSRGVSTDFDGKYEIQVAEGETLVFTSLGFVTQEKVVAAIGGG